MIAYVNGNYVADADAVVSIRDRGFMLGDGIFDVWRTYDGRQVRSLVEKHLDRLRRSVNAMELDGDSFANEMDKITTELVERNKSQIEQVGDVTVWSVVTRGIAKNAIEGFEAGNPTRVAFCNPIPFKAIGNLYETGVSLVPSMMTQNPFAGSDPRIKGLSRLAYVRGERKRARSGPGTWVALFDRDGYITEATGAALCLIEGNTIIRPPRHQLLASVSLRTFCELGTQLGFDIQERPLSPYDFLNADAVYLLSSSIAFLPVVDFDGVRLHSQDEVGPAVQKAWIDLVGFDFVAQARRLGSVESE